MTELTHNEEVVLYLLLTAGSIPKTRLIKLLYLTDREFVKKTGKQMTDFKYIRALLGPYPPQLEEVFFSLTGEFLIDTCYVSEPRGSYYLLTPTTNAEKIHFALSDQERNVILYVTNKTKKMTLNELILFCLDLPEVRNTELLKAIELRKEALAVLPVWIIEQADIFMWKGNNIPNALLEYLEEKGISADDINYIALVRKDIAKDFASYWENTFLAPSYVRIIEVESELYDVVVGYHA